jgi:hypothetical protein
MPSGDNGKLKMRLPDPSPEARRIAELVGDLVVGETIDATTDHAWIAPFHRRLTLPLFKFAPS